MRLLTLSDFDGICCAVLCQPPCEHADHLLKEMVEICKL